MSEWKPIETAPKDGQVILGFWPSTSSDRVEWRQYGLTVWRGHEWVDPENGDEFREPSHWMPLPLPPDRVRDEV